MELSTKVLCKMDKYYNPAEVLEVVGGLVCSALGVGRVQRES